MRALLDVNVLIALLDSDHTSHVVALSWFEKHAREGWASCPITQNGCVRIMISLLDPDVVDSTRIHGPRQLTDIYLLALAVEQEGRFVTFDTGVPLAVVRKATADNLVVL